MSVIASLLIANRGEIAGRIIRTAGGTGCALAIMLAACGQQQQAANHAAAAPPTKAAAPATSPPPAKAKTASACAPAPQLVPGEGFSDARNAFAAGSAPFRRLEANFAAAYRASCTPALLQRHALIVAGAAERDRLRVKNAPDANVA